MRENNKITYIYYFRLSKHYGSQGPQKLSFNSKPPTVNGNLHFCNLKKGLPCQILGGKTGNNVQIDPQTMDKWSKKLNIRE